MTSPDLLEIKCYVHLTCNHLWSKIYIVHYLYFTKLLGFDNQDHLS